MRSMRAGSVVWLLLVGGCNSDGLGAGPVPADLAAPAPADLAVPDLAPPVDLARAPDLFASPPCPLPVGIDGRSPWPAEGGDQQRSRRSNASGPRSGTTKWTATVNSSGGAPAVSQLGLVYVASTDLGLRALDAVTGKLAWTVALPGPVAGTPVLSANLTLFVGAHDGKLYALSAATGERLWSYTTSGPITASPTLDYNCTVFIGSSDHNLYALDTVTGRQKWVYTTPEPVTSTPALGIGGGVFFSGKDHDVYALRGDIGALLWRVEADAPTSPAIGQTGAIYFGQRSGFRAVNAGDGATVWTFDQAPGSLDSSPAIGGDDTVYFNSDDGHVYALDGWDGHVRWSYPARFDRPVSAPVLGVDGILYVAAQDLLALESATGKLLFKVGGDGSALMSPALGGGQGRQLLVPSWSGRIIAISE